MSTARRLAAVTATVVVVALTGGSGAAAEPNPASGPHPTSATVLTADLGTGAYGSFAESMAATPDGDLLVSVTDWNTDWEGVGDPNEGRLVRVDPTTGTAEAFGEPIDLGPYGMQCGVAVDDDGRAYVAVAFTGEYGMGAAVYRVPEDGPAEPVLALPEYAWPNGLAIDGTDVYATDSGSGVIWSGSTEAVGTAVEPWFSDPDGVLAPNPPKKRYPGIGANGIAVVEDGLLVTNWSTGSIYLIPVEQDGEPGAAELVVRDKRLMEADGIAVDSDGRIWVATNARYGGLAVVDAGHVSITRTQNMWLDYPTQPVPIGDVLYLANGSFFHGTPFVTAFTGLIG